MFEFIINIIRNLLELFNSATDRMVDRIFKSEKAAIVFLAIAVALSFILIPRTLIFLFFFWACLRIAPRILINLEDSLH